MATQDKNQETSKQHEFKKKELTRLQVFIGKWHAEGKSYAGGQDQRNPYASAVPWTSDESYEWLPGNFFVLHKWNAKAGEQVFIGTEIIGYDENENHFFTYFLITQVFIQFTKQGLKEMFGISPSLTPGLR